MKCPECHFVCSELRDLCPRCLADLRPFKQGAGLTVIDAKASYQELLDKAGQKKTAETVPDSGVVSLIKSLFAVKTAEKAAVPPQAASESQEELPEQTEPLFESALASLRRTENQIELSYEQFSPTSKSEEVVLQFDLAYESISSPERQRYSEDIARSESRRVQASVLEKELARVEKVISAPQITLKGFHSSAAPAPDHASATRQEVPRPVFPASLLRRLAAFLLDAALIALLAAAVSVCLLAVNFYGLQQLAAGGLQLDVFDGIFAAEVFVTAVLVFSLLYFIISIPILGASPGGRILGLIISCHRGARFEFSNVLVRSLTFPLSMLLFGYLPLIWRKDALHDVLSRTRVYRQG